MKEKITCIALAMILVICTKAQGFGEIHGRVTDSGGMPLPDVVVVVMNGVDQYTETSDESGTYKVKPLRPGTYSVFGFMSGYVSDTIRKVLVNPNKITLDIHLTMNNNALLPEARVVEYKVKLINKDGDHIQTLLAEDLLHRPTTHGGKLGTIVSSMSSDVKPAAEGAGMSVRGSREGGVLYFVDGMKIRNSEVAVPASGISSVSLYTGGIPAAYGDTTGGVVIVETKSYLEEYYKKLTQ